MDTAAVDWLPPLAVLAAALVGGTLFVWRVYTSARKAPSRPAAAPLELRDLLGKRDVVVQQLRELEDTASKRSPEQLARERYALELEAARVLLELDTRAGALAAPPRKKGAPAPAPTPAADAPPAPVAGNPALRGFLWGTGSMAAIGLLLFSVSQAARPREQGGSVTGDTPMGRSSGSESTAPASSDAREAQLRASLARNPDDLDARLELTRVYLARRDMMAVWNETQDVLRRSPGNARALDYQSLVRVAMGQPDLALGMLKQAIAKEPNLMEAYLHMALAYARMGRMQEAEAVMAHASRRFPGQGALMQRVLGELRQQAAEGPPAVGEGDPHAGVPPPGAPAGEVPAGPRAAGATSSAGSAAESGRRVAGVVDIDRALRGTLAPGAVVFVIVREAGVEKGPPVAVKRLPASAFPIAFSIGEADSMAGEPIPDKVRIEARVDSDGDPVTRDPADPSVRVDDVKAGTTNLTLVMKR